MASKLTRRGLFGMSLGAAVAVSVPLDPLPVVHLNLSDGLIMSGDLITFAGDPRTYRARLPSDYRARNA